MVLLMLLLATAAVFLFSGCREEADETYGEREPDRIPVRVQEVQRGDIVKSSEFTGTLAAQSRVEVVPKIGGEVSRVLVEVGDQVTEGDLLVQLEVKELQAELRQAEANLAAARTGLKVAEAGYDDARRTLERMEKLYEEGAVSREQLDAARLQYESADPEQARAQLEQAEAALEMVRLQLSYTRITAPLSGTITSRFVERGGMIGTGSPVATIVDLDRVLLDVQVTEHLISHLRPGEKVEVMVEVVSPEPREGIISYAGSAADLQSRKFPVRIKLDNPGHQLKPGMFSRVTLCGEKRKDVLLVPRRALVQLGEEEVVYVVEEGTAEARLVVSGLSDGDYLEIKEGVEPGEKVVVVGQEHLQDGTTVKVVENGGKQDVAQ